jgi:4-hydroxy-tetrahydrodipicolinate synthase
VIDWSGIFHILATPFTDDGALDVDGPPRLVETALATRVSGITVHLVAGQVPVVASAGRRIPG